MNTNDLVGLSEKIEIAPDSDRRDIEFIGQLLDTDLAQILDQLQNGLLPLRGKLEITGR